MRRCVFLWLIVAVAVPGALPAAADDKPARDDSKPAEASAALLEALKDKDPTVRLQAAQLLTEMGEAKAALPVVIDLLRTPEQGLRLQAAQMLKQVGSSRLRPFLPALTRVLKEGNSDARLQAVQQTRPALEQLYQALTPEQKAIVDHPFMRR